MKTDTVTIESLGTAELPSPQFNLESYLNESESPAFEIAPGMTAEEMSALFFAPDALKEAPEKVYRLNASGHRYYYTFDEKGQPIFYVSVTTFIKQTMPTSPVLLKWIAGKGYDESQAFAQEKASYGTFMHSQIADLLIKGSYDLNALKSKLKAYIESEQLPSSFINYVEDFKKDILAFAQFAIDVNLKPIAIELVLTHPTDGYAGAMDLACEMDADVSGFYGEVYKTGVNAGKEKKSTERKRVRAIVDFKSGKKGFFEEHEVQLHAYKTMWNIHFPSTPIERVYNWAPKDWRGTVPSYNLKDQTDSSNAKKLPYLVQLARIEDDKRDNTVVLCSGEINFQTTKDLSGNISEFTLSEIVKKKTERREIKPGADKGVIVDDLEVPEKPKDNWLEHEDLDKVFAEYPDKVIQVVPAKEKIEEPIFVQETPNINFANNNINYSGTLNAGVDKIHISPNSNVPNLTVSSAANYGTSGLFSDVKATETPKEESASNDLKSNNNEIDF